MPSLSPFFSVIIVIVAISLCVSTAVRSESSIRLPSDGGGPGDLCPRSTPASCPVSCFRADPVCGIDGVTYWCGCADAACSGAFVAKLGFCEVGNGGDGLVSGQALLLVHMVWLIVLGFSVLCGLL